MSQNSSILIQPVDQTISGLKAYILRSGRYPFWLVDEFYIPIYRYDSSLHFTYWWYFFRFLKVFRFVVNLYFLSIRFVDNFYVLSIRFVEKFSGFSLNFRYFLRLLTISFWYTTSYKTYTICPKYLSHLSIHNRHSMAEKYRTGFLIKCRLIV